MLEFDRVSDVKGKICLIICLSIAVLVAGCTQTQDEDFQPVEVNSAEDVMQNVNEGYGFINTLGGTVISRNVLVVSKGSEEKRNWEHEFWMKKDGSYKYRVETNGGIEVSNGSVTWMYNTSASPDSRTVQVVSEAFADVDMTKEDNPSLSIMRYAPIPDTYWWIKSSLVMPEEPALNLSGEGKVAGRDCYVVDVYEGVNQTKEPFSKLWIDKEYYYPLKIERGTLDKLEEGRMTPNFTIWYESIEFDLGIEDSKFEFQVPDKVERIGYCGTLGDAIRMNCNWKELG